MFGLVVGRMREGGTSSDVRGCWTGAADRYEERKRELRISAGMLAQGRSSSALAVKDVRKEAFGKCSHQHWPFSNPSFMRFDNLLRAKPWERGHRS